MSLCPKTFNMIKDPKPQSKAVGETWNAAPSWKKVHKSQWPPRNSTWQLFDRKKWGMSICPRYRASSNLLFAFAKKKIPTNNVGPVTGNDADVPGWYLESGSLQSASEKKKRQRTWWVSWDPWCWCLTRQIGQCDQMPEKRNLSSQQWMRPANPWKAIRQEVIMSKPG